jgi:hypothetical protein
MEKQQRTDALRKVEKAALMARVDLDYYGLGDDGELEAEERRIEEAAGAFGSEAVLESERVPTDAEIREGLERLLRGECAEVLI